MLQQFVFRFFSAMIILLSPSLIKPITLIQHYAYSNYLVWNKPDTQAYQKKKRMWNLYRFPKVFGISKRKKQLRMIGPEWS